MRDTFSRPRKTDVEPVDPDRLKQPNRLPLITFDALHERFLGEMKVLFDTHKASLGWGHLKLVYE